MLKDSYALNHQVVPIQMFEANIQKQPPRGVLTKRCSEIFSKFTREYPRRGVISIKLLYMGVLLYICAYFQNTFV